MLVLGHRRGEARVQFLVAVPKEAMKKFIEAARDDAANIQEEVLLNKRGRFYWLEMCSRIFLCSPCDQTNTLGEALAMRDLKDYLEAADPDGDFPRVLDQICRDSVGRSVSELGKALPIVRAWEHVALEHKEALEVIDCRRLTPVELADARGSLPKEWLPLLVERTKKRLCLLVAAFSTGAVVASGIAQG
ncbi:hypothetical protein GNI_104770 [Gregarina niphandrodes]|uniref:Uncharacterized protein n=1 Tax=Gregarina niphandrodes TaxID=110365 RepID=A0A023B419_GRENI|nr:hypothetical protein GNI_104770 [Gregarina niphandrodes]EZG56256.1 hypothetical protein GNI_104770 [Gregarina niphandrodes]|eukprot:XP_011131304.1 hypothetical protein GNI_104770 [Gregarina niphandrodes]